MLIHQKDPSCAMYKSNDTTPPLLLRPNSKERLVGEKRTARKTDTPDISASDGMSHQGNKSIVPKQKGNGDMGRVKGTG